MFSFAKTDSDDSIGYRDCKILYSQPLSNTKNGLEFQLPPQKRCLKLADSALAFSIDLPDNYIPDNDFCNKLFENIVIDICQDTITKRGSELDNSISSFFINKTMYDENYMESTMATQGVYDLFNDEAEEIDGEQISARQFSTDTIRVTRNGLTEKWLRYDFILPLNHGIARTYQCLPAKVELRLKYNRAPTNFSILKIRQNVSVLDDNNILSAPCDYTEPVIPIIKPVFRAMYLKSDELDSQMRKYEQYPYEMEYVDYVIRKPILGVNESDFLIDLKKGRFPTYAVFALAPLDRLNGSETRSLTKFERHDLQSFEILLEGIRIEGHPLVSNADFYNSFLINTHRYQNPWSSGVLPLSQFISGNFFIVVNFEDLEKTDAQTHFQVKLTFKKPLTEKYVLLYMPMTTRLLTIAPDGDVNVD
jgi:hypothetical protein